MNVCYCDLCGLPVHGKRFYLVVVPDENKPGAYRQPPTSKEQYEIDETCYALLGKIFDLKKAKIAEIKKYLEEQYKLPSNRKTKSKSKKGKKIYFNLQHNKSGDKHGK
jgi:hypothetical protein